MAKFEQHRGDRFEQRLFEQANQEANEDALTRLRAQLGDVVFELAWAKGATMATEQALALALS